MQKKKNLNVTKEFSRFAYQYDNYNMIQEEVAKNLILNLSRKIYKNIIDIGCGTGAVYKQLVLNDIKFESLAVVDASTEMLKCHPSGDNICKYYEDFNNKFFLDNLNEKNYDIVLSSSALQWSSDLEYTVEKLTKISSTLIASIFTANTFKTIHKIAGISSPVYTDEYLRKVITKYYNADFTVHTYRLEFNTTREMFQYIKKSGVSSGEKKLSYIQTKALMQSYPLNYLEFEVLFVRGESKNINAQKSIYRD